MWGEHVLAHYCRTQESIALSSGEAELRASCKGTSEALGIQELVRFLCRTQCGVRHYSNDPEALLHVLDSSAAFGIVKRKGAGGIKHLSVRELWIQETYRQVGNEIQKIPRAQNVADAMCSVSTEADRARHLSTMSVTITHLPHRSEGGDGILAFSFEFAGSDVSAQHAMFFII